MTPTRWIPGLEIDSTKKAIKNVPWDLRITWYVTEGLDEHRKILMEQYPQFFAVLAPAP